MDFKKLLYKMLVKHYLSDNIKATFEDFALGLRNAWAGLVDMQIYKIFASTVADA